MKLDMKVDIKVGMKVGMMKVDRWVWASLGVGGRE